jgi:hypothetical protein
MPVSEDPGNTKSGIEGNVQFSGKLIRVKRAAGEKTAGDFECGDFMLAVIGSNYDFFGGLVFFDVHFAKRDSSFLQKRFGAAAIWAPLGGVHRQGFHTRGY